MGGHSHGEVVNRPKNENDHLETDPPIIHGLGDQNVPPRVPRADKAAPLPEPEHGLAIPGLPAAAGHCQGIKRGPNVGQGKGPLHVDV